MNTFQKSALALLSFPTLLLVAACDDSAGVADVAPQVALVRIVMTDAPIDYIEEALVDIGQVSLVPGDGSGHIVISDDGTDGFVNLLDFQGAATTPIGQAEIEPGEFSQLRMVVEAAHVKLKDRYAFRDGTTEMALKVPSGAQSGIKLNLHDAEDGGPVAIIPGETVLVLDFDVGRSFVLNGNFETRAGVHGVHFQPTLRVVAMDVAASISGVVTTSLDGVAVEGLTVTAEPTDPGTVEGYQTMAGTAITDADGAYTIHFLVPGSYDVTVALDGGLGTEPASQSVTVGNSEDATGADFEIVDVRGSIAGTVSTALSGVSVEGLTVTATPTAEGAAPLTATTAANGTYTIESVVPGEYTITVGVGTGQATTPASRVVTVEANGEVTAMDFAIIASG